MNHKLRSLPFPAQRALAFPFIHDLVEAVDMNPGDTLPATKPMIINNRDDNSTNRHAALGIDGTNDSKRRRGGF